MATMLRVYKNLKKAQKTRIRINKRQRNEFKVLQMACFISDKFQIKNNKKKIDKFNFQIQFLILEFAYRH